MKTVVIPDIHNKVWRVKAILEQEEPYDRAIFLGDYFDHFDDTPDDAREVARWLKDSLYEPRHIHLWGNHDLLYSFDNQSVACGGYTIYKKLAIADVLKPKDWARIKFFWMADGWLFTHAGLSQEWLPLHMKPTMTNIKGWLRGETIECLKRLNTREWVHWFYVIGDARRRHPNGTPRGGIFFCDISEFTPIRGIPQICGHTRVKPFPNLVRGDTGLERVNSIEVLKTFLSPNDGWNVYLDCHLAYYGVIQDGKLQIKESPPIIT